MDTLLKKYDIDVISHSNAIDGFRDFLKINWIPDFQHLHLPELFSDEDNRARNKYYKIILQKSDVLLVSSFDAYKDVENFAIEYIDKVKVLQFVSQPNKTVFTLEKNYLHTLENKYNFTGKFFYLPNQFWKHKNHMIIFEAVKILKENNIDILILCSGLMKDYRHPEYIDNISLFLKEHDLENNIKLLGLIDYSDVLYFMRYSIAVINPSLFEGWSSTVEECKSIGKNMILSDIPIHREQNPLESIFFHPYNIGEVTNILKSIWINDTIEIPNSKLEKQASLTLKERTDTFAMTYQKIIEDNFSKKH